MGIEQRAIRLALFGRPNVALRTLQPPPRSNRRYPDRKARRRVTRRQPPARQQRAPADPGCTALRPWSD